MLIRCEIGIYPLSQCGYLSARQSVSIVTPLASAFIAWGCLAKSLAANKSIKRHPIIQFQSKKRDAELWRRVESW